LKNKKKQKHVFCNNDRRIAYNPRPSVSRVHESTGQCIIRLSVNQSYTHVCDTCSDRVTLGVTLSHTHAHTVSSRPCVINWQSVARHNDPDRLHSQIDIHWA